MFKWQLFHHAFAKKFLNRLFIERKDISINIKRGINLCKTVYWKNISPMKVKISKIFP